MSTMAAALNPKLQIILKTPLPTKPTPQFISISLRQNIKHLACKASTRCSLANGDTHDQIQSYQKPSEIQWKKELCNSVQLIGIVGLPVQLNQLSSGKAVASTRLAVRKSPTDTTWINLTFWDELAHIAHQYVEKGHQIYVSGRLVSDTTESEDGKQQTYYKVVVQQLNFVEKNSPPPTRLYGETSSSMASVNTKSSTQELWQAFFANPVDWWDNRKNKKNPKAPDFKHKDTGEALWIEGRYNPPWVKSHLEILDSQMQSFPRQENVGLFSYLKGDL